MDSIDSLSIQISADSQKAAKAIDSLINTVDKLNNSISKVPDFSNITKGISKLNKIDTLKFSNISETVNQMGKMFGAFSNIKFDNKGMQSLLNSITRLADSNIGGLANANFEQLGSGINQLITTLSNAPAVQQSIISLTNSVGNLARVGEKIPLVSNSLGSLGTALRNFINDISSSANISENITNFTNAIGVLAKTGKTIPTVTLNLGAFGAELKKLIKELSNAPNISRNVIDLTNAMANLAKTGKSSGTAAKSLSGVFDKIYTSSNKASNEISLFNKKLRSLRNVLLSYVGIWQVFSFAKQAVEISSSLTEIQNVVDVTFGNFKNKIESLSKVSIPELGMSELTAKKIASKFQAMGTAMGFTQSTMSDMSVALTRLAGDMASFYNVEQSVVGEDLESIFTGQTKPLRQYGLDLTEATLQEWALKNGIDANIKSMSQMEKTLLRYQYVMANTGAAQGDFIRTANTWANQIRILKENFKALSSVIGSVFINALKPLVSALNGAMASVISFATTISNALGKLFGWKYEDTSGGIVQDFADMADNAGDLADETGKTADNADKLRRTLMGFDEINPLSSQADNSTSDSPGTNSNVGGADVAGGQWVKTDGILKKFESSIDSFYELGKYINKVLTNALNGINWDSIYEGARNFGTGLAEFLNGLISPDLFYAVGRTIANSLNTAIYTALSFGETFDWSNLGESIASGVNGFFENFDAKSLAKAINKWVNGLFKMVLTALTNIKWGTIAKRIAEFIGNLDISTIAIVIGAITIKKIAKMQLAKTVLSQLAKAIQSDISKAVIAKFGTENAGNVGSAIWNWIKKSTTKGAKNNAQEISKVLVGNISTSTSSAFAGLSNTLKFSIGGAGILTEATLINKAFKTIAEQGKLTSGSLAEISAGAGVAFGALKLIGALNPFTALIAGAAGLAGAIIGIKQSFDEADFNANFELMKKLGGVTMQELGEQARTAFSNITQGLESMKNKISSMKETKENISETISEINLMREAIDKGAYTANEKIPQIIEQMQRLLSDSKTIFNEEYDVIVKGLCGSLGEALEAAGFSTSEIATNLATMKASGDESIGGLERRLKDLYVQFENGAISAEEFGSQSAPIIEILQKINADNATDSINKFSEALDVAKYTTANGFDTGTFEADIAQVGDALINARELVDTNAGGIKDSINKFITELEALGTDTSGIDWTAMLNCNEQTVTETKAQLDRAMLEYSDKIQEGLINQIPAVVEDATADYKELSPFRKLFTSEDDYVAKRINEWKQNTLNPASESIKQSMEQLGIDGAEWSKEAASKIINEMYDTTTETSYEGVEITTSKLKSNYKEIIDKSMGGLSETMKQYGKDSVDGYNNGIEEGKSRTESIMQKFSDWIKNAFHDSSLRFGSPSETMKQYGQWTDEGFNIGVESKRSVILNTLSDFANDIILKFKNGIADIPVISRDVFSKARDIISDSLDRIKNLFNFTWRLPDIKLPHFSISGSFSLNPPSVPTFGIDWYANGGFPEDGLFMANHNELVGKFSNGKTAVANNEQIIQGIQNGVASAITNAVVPYLVQIVNKDTTIQLDGREVGRASVNYINGEKRRGAEPLLGY